jgi:hypothetical protein
MRVALLVLLAGCSYVYLLLIAPFFRPAHVLRMLKADIPRVRKFGAEIAGTRGEVEFAQVERAVREKRHRVHRAVDRKFRRSGKMTEMTHHDVTAELDSLHEYFDCLCLLADAAIEGKGLLPEIPSMDELRVVNGWVVWNGKPVWSPLTRSVTRAQPVRAGTRREALAAWATAEHRCLDVTQARLDHDTERVRRGNHSAERKARNEAEHGFYVNILAQARDGIDHGAPPPVCPDPEELQFADGWLMWKGEPVWWAGEGPAVVAAGASSHSGGTATASAPSAPARPRLRRLLTLPWRRAAA